MTELKALSKLSWEDYKMAKKIINTGSRDNAGNGDPLRVAFSKINDNFTELYDIAQTPEATQDIDGGSASTVYDDENQ